MPHVGSYTTFFPRKGETLTPDEVYMLRVMATMQQQVKERQAETPQRIGFKVGG